MEAADLEATVFPLKKKLKCCTINKKLPFLLDILTFGTHSFFPLVAPPFYIHPLLSAFIVLSFLKHFTMVAALLLLPYKGNSINYSVYRKALRGKFFYRKENYATGGEEYLTFTDCSLCHPAGVLNPK